MDLTNPAAVSSRSAEADALLSDLEQRLDELSQTITRQIRVEVPGYAALPLAEHARDVDAQLRNVVGGLRARQLPPAAAVEHARGVGRRRAARDLSLPEVIEAYHIAYRELWNEMLSQAQRIHPARAAELVSEVALLWNWFHRLSAAVAAAHADETRVRATERAALCRRLVDVLRDRETRIHDGDAIAQRLGFDAGGEFTIARAHGLGDTTLDDLGDRLSHLDGVVHCSGDALGTVVISQGASDTEVLTTIHAVSATARVGVGLRRPGIAGAKLSLLDAEDALQRAATPGTDVYFADDWLIAALASSADRLQPLLAKGQLAARENPALAQTVRAYADERFSVSSCARRLGIHPNSAKYRLERWHTLTGWDAQSFAGLVKSLVSLELVDGIGAT